MVDKGKPKELKKSRRSPRKRNGKQAMSPGKPRNEQQALNYAALRAIGATQNDAASAVGVSERTGRSWEAANWYGEIHRRAVNAHHIQLRALALRTINQSLQEGDAKVAMWALERLEGEHFGNMQKIQLSADESVGVKIYIPDDDSD